MILKPYIKAETEYIIGLRRHFHQNPEASLHEYDTALKIENELHAMGIAHKRVGDTGVLGIIKGKNPKGKRIILRADTDALRMQDKKEEEYRSIRKGLMHACGHDAHTAALLGAAKVLAQKIDEFDGEVYLFFQQAEEIGQGAKQFIKNGYLGDASRVFGVHVASDIPVGKVGIVKGAVNAAVDHLVIKITGKSAHVSTPQKGVDALYVASQIAVNLQAVVSRQTDPVDTVVVGLGVLKAGTAYNIIAGEAVLEGTVRTFSVESRKDTREKIKNIVKHIAAAYDADAQIAFEDFASPLVNHNIPVEEAMDVATGIVGEDNIITDRAKSLGGDDFAEYLLLVPGVYVYIGTANSRKPNTILAHHNELFDIDEDGVLIAANMYVDYALAQLKSL